MKPPHDDVAESATLGAVLSDPSRFADVAAIVGPEDFYVSAHREVFEAMVSVDLEEEWPEPVAVVAELRRRGSSVGPLDVAKHAEDVPVPSAATTYATKVARLAAQRRLVSGLARALDDASHDRLDPSAIASRASLDLLDAVGSQVGEAEALAVHVDHAIEVVERGFEGGLRTGFVGLDDLLGGLTPGQLILVASRPGVGKSALVAQVARNVAERSVPVALFSLEMSAFEVSMRLLCSEAGVPFDRVRSTRASLEDWRALAAGADALFGLPLMIADRANVRVPEVRSVARRIPNVGLVIVDYLQLLSAAREKGTRQEEVSEISRGLKLLARELSVPVIAVCQLNRDPERRQDKRPQLSDLRESGSLEQDADVVVMLYREPTDPSAAEAIVAKHRNGPTDSVRLTFRRDLTRFEPRF